MSSQQEAPSDPSTPVRSTSRSTLSPVQANTTPKTPSPTSPTSGPESDDAASELASDDEPIEEDDDEQALESDDSDEPEGGHFYEQDGYERKVWPYSPAAFKRACAWNPPHWALKWHRPGPPLKRGDVTVVCNLALLKGPFLKSNTRLVADTIAEKEAAGLPTEITLKVASQMPRPSQEVSAAYHHSSERWTYYIKGGHQAEIPFSIHGHAVPLVDYLKPAPKLSSLKAYPHFNYGVDSLYLMYNRCSTAFDEANIYDEAVTKAVEAISKSAKQRPAEKDLHHIKVDWCPSMHSELDSFVDLFSDIRGLKTLEVCTHDADVHYPTPSTHKIHVSREAEEARLVVNGLMNLRDYPFEVIVYDFNGEETVIPAAESEDENAESDEDN